jgi:fibronectin type 3 domain-containing protein
LQAIVSFDRDAPLRAPNPHSMQFYRSDTAGGPYQLLATITAARSYEDTVTGGTTYYYVVTAVVNGSGESANSNETSATAR